MAGEGQVLNHLMTSAAVLAALNGLAAIPFTSPVSVPVGSAGAPSISFGTDQTSGFYSAGAGKIDVSISGTKVAEWTSAGLSTSAQITSTVATGTAPLVVASTTAVANLNASLLLGNTWAAPGAIGGGTPAAGAFTTLSATGVITSTLATGTAPFTVASTTVVGNLNVSQLLGGTWAIPGAIGSTTASTGKFTSVTDTGLTSGRVTFATTAGLLTDSAGLTYDLTNLFVGSNTTAGGIGINGQATSVRDLSWSTAGVVRWLLRADGTAELGSNAGTDFNIIARTDAGGTVDIPFKITRAATGDIALTRQVVITNSSATLNVGVKFADTAASGRTFGVSSGAVAVGRFSVYDYTGGGERFSIDSAGTVKLYAGVASTSTTTGTEVITGGIGVSGDAYIGATLNVGSSIKSTSATAGIGYATGAGGTVAQSTSKATGVSLSTVCGTITLNNASLAATTSVAFTWTNTAIAATDHIDIQHDSVGTLGGYSVCVTPGAGSATVTVRNNTAGALAEAIVLRFFVKKAVIS